MTYYLVAGLRAGWPAAGPCPGPVATTDGRRRTKKQKANSAYRPADTDRRTRKQNKAYTLRTMWRSSAGQLQLIRAAMHGEETTNRNATHAHAPPLCIAKHLQVATNAHDNKRSKFELRWRASVERTPPAPVRAPAELLYIKFTRKYQTLSFA